MGLMPILMKNRTKRAVAIFCNSSSIHDCTFSLGELNSSFVARSKNR